MLGLFALLWAQTADLASVRLCVPDERGQVQVELGFVREDGRVWWSPPQAPGRRRLFDPSDHATARDRDWFDRREPLQVDGRTFAYVEPHQATLAFNRYYREHEPVDGIATAVPLGREETVLFILTDPVGCWFARYQAEQAD